MDSADEVNDCGGGIREYREERDYLFGMKGKKGLVEVIPHEKSRFTR